VTVAARARPFEEALAISCERRSTSKLRLVPEPGKGRPPLRKCPDDFDVIFVEIGRLDCETFYRAARITIDRWLLERGKERLIKQRAKFVEHQRQRSKDQARSKMAALPVADRQHPADEISLCLARAAAHHLRANRNGGWMVSRRLDGTWLVGHSQKSSKQLLEMAIGVGFDVEHAEASCSIEERD
jgi:hypothetical protein